MWLRHNSLSLVECQVIGVMTDKKTDQIEWIEQMEAGF